MKDLNQNYFINVKIEYINDMELLLDEDNNPQDVLLKIYWNLDNVVSSLNWYKQALNFYGPSKARALFWWTNIRIKWFDYYENTDAWTASKNEVTLLWGLHNAKEVSDHELWHMIDYIEWEKWEEIWDDTSKIFESWKNTLGKGIMWKNSTGNYGNLSFEWLISLNEWIWLSCSRDWKSSKNEYWKIPEYIDVNKLRDQNSSKLIVKNWDIEENIEFKDFIYNDSIDKDRISDLPFKWFASIYSLKNWCEDRAETWSYWISNIEKIMSCNDSILSLKFYLLCKSIIINSQGKKTSVLDKDFFISKWLNIDTLQNKLSENYPYLSY